MTPEEMDNLGKGCQGCGCLLMLCTLPIILLIVAIVGCS
jgi:hypothetical protein